MIFICTIGHRIPTKATTRYILIYHILLHHLAHTEVGVNNFKIFREFSIVILNLNTKLRSERVAISSRQTHRL